MGAEHRYEDRYKCFYLHSKEIYTTIYDNCAAVLRTTNKKWQLAKIKKVISHNIIQTRLTWCVTIFYLFRVFSLVLFTWVSQYYTSYKCKQENDTFSKKSYNISSTFIYF